MTADDIRELAVRHNPFGDTEPFGDRTHWQLGRTTELTLRALADVVEAIGPPAKRDVVSEFRPELRAALARVENLPPNSTSPSPP